MLGLQGYLTHKSALWGAFLLLPFFATLLGDAACCALGLLPSNALGLR